MLMSKKVFIAAEIEIAYAVITRALFPQYLDFIYLELAVSAFRVATIVAYLGLFRDVIQSRVKNTPTLRHPFLVAGVAIALVIPFLFRGCSLDGRLITAIVFALTSIVVGLREEILYRAVFLNLLQPRIGIVGSLLFSTVVFVLYHYGAQPFTALWLTECACMSLLFGLIYIRSGSLLTVTAIHSIYDGIWFLGPYIKVPIAEIWKPAFLISALALVVVWWRVGQQPAR